MQRREFMTALGGMAAVWPLGARAQQGLLPVIGYLGPSSPDRASSLLAFLQGLREAGFVDGLNVKIEYRWANNHNDLLPELAADLVKRQVSVICANGGLLAAKAARAATTTIPIVFNIAGDPVREGLVTSLSRPGGNATGAMNLTGGPTDAKAVQYLRELMPAVELLGLLVNPTNVLPESAAPTAARQLGWDFKSFEASTDEELEAAFAAMANQKIGAVNVVPDTFFSAHRTEIVALASRYAIPTSYYFRDFVIAGGLMSYGPDFKEAGRVAGNYVGRILKGEKPADLPVQQAVKVELVINLKTAKSLGLTFPTALLVRADEVIE